MSSRTFDSLLAVQALDTEADQLRHRRESLPERARLAELEVELRRLNSVLAEVRERREELAREERRIEEEVAGVTEKAAKVDRTLYSGTVTNPRELQALQEEFAALGRRQRTLEDRELELMEAGEPLDAELASLEDERSSLEDSIEQHRAVIDEAETSIAEELAQVEGRRADAVPDVPAELLGEYEVLRGRLGGVGVARLVGTSCSGCHLQLAAIEIDRLRKLPPGELVHCAECGRILVPG